MCQEQPFVSPEPLKIELTTRPSNELSHLFLVDNLRERGFYRLRFCLCFQYLLRILNQVFIQPEMFSNFFYYILHSNPRNLKNEIKKVAKHFRLDENLIK